MSAGGVGRAPQPRHQRGLSFCSFHEAWKNLAFPRLPTRFGIFQNPSGAEQNRDVQTTPAPHLPPGGSSPLPLSFSPALVEVMRSLPPLCCLLPAWTPTVRPGTCLIELAVNEASFHIPCFYFAALFSRFGETSLHQTSCRDGESVFFFCHLSMTMNEGCVSFLLPLLTPLGSFLCCFIFLPFFGSGGCSTGRGIDPSAPASAPASPLRLHRPRGSDKPHPQG